MWFMDEVTLAFLEVNEAAIRHYGYTRDEFSRMTILDIRLPEVPLVLAHGQRSRAAPSYERVGPPDMWRHRIQDGTVIDVDIARSAVVFRGRKASLVMAYDVTERTRGEAALRKSYEELDRRVQERTFALAQANATLRSGGCRARADRGGITGREERLHLAQQAGQMGTWEWDVQTGTLRWSRRWSLCTALPRQLPGHIRGLPRHHPSGGARLVQASGGPCAGVQDCL